MQKAFDLIVERLEEKIRNLTHNHKLYEKKHDLLMKQMCESEIVAYVDAIEIVNQVAEEYKSTEHISCSTEEVCEWVEKSVNSIKLVRDPHRLRLFHIEEERQYCPYCGKKIKVVK